MSWDDLTRGGAWSLAASPAESARFGVAVARLTIRADGAAPADITGGTADVIVVRYPAGRLELAAVLAATGWTVLAAGTLVYWALPVGAGRRPAEVPHLRTDPADSAALVDAVVADSFAGYGNHYRANPLFAADAVLAGYQEWACASLTAPGTVALALHADGDPVGLATCAAAGQDVEILLAGLVSRAQRRGWYAHLLAAAEAYAAEVGATRLLISTQAHHAAVQRAWARYGFEPLGAVETVHLVRPGLLP